MMGCKNSGVRGNMQVFWCPQIPSMRWRYGSMLPSFRYISVSSFYVVLESVYIASLEGASAGPAQQKSSLRAALPGKSTPATLCLRHMYSPSCRIQAANALSKQNTANEDDVDCVESFQESLLSELNLAGPEVTPRFCLIVSPAMGFESPGNHSVCEVMPDGIASWRQRASPAQL